MNKRTIAKISKLVKYRDRMRREFKKSHDRWANRKIVGGYEEELQLMGTLHDEIQDIHGQILRILKIHVKT